MNNIHREDPLLRRMELTGQRLRDEILLEVTTGVKYIGGGAFCK